VTSRHISTLSVYNLVFIKSAGTEVLFRIIGGSTLCRLRHYYCEVMVGVGLYAELGVRYQAAAVAHRPYPGRLPSANATPGPAWPSWVYSFAVDRLAP